MLHLSTAQKECKDVLSFNKLPALAQLLDKPAIIGPSGRLKRTGKQLEES